MLAADADFQVRTRFASALGGHLHELPDAFLIQSRERSLLQDALGQVRRKDLVDVIPRETERGLSEIVGAKREEFGFLSDLVRH